MRVLLIAQVLGGVLKSDAKGSGSGNHMLLGCLCLIANTVSMVRLVLCESTTQRLCMHEEDLHPRCEIRLPSFGAGAVLHIGKAPGGQVQPSVHRRVGIHCRSDSDGSDGSCDCTAE